MSYLEQLMQELDLSPNTISSTLSKIETICAGFEINEEDLYYIRLNGNGNGDGDGDN